MADEGNTLTLETTKGPVVIRMRPDLAPNHVAHIKKLAGEGFYDGVVFHRVIELEAAAAGVRGQAARLGHRGREFRFCCGHRGLFDIHLDLVRLFIELSQDVAHPYSLVVVDQDRGDVAGNSGCDEGDMPIDVSVIRGNGVQRGLDDRIKNVSCHRYSDHNPGQ